MSLKGSNPYLDRIDELKESALQDAESTKRLRYKDITPRYMFNHTLGLAWYRFFQVLLFFWMLTSFATACVGPADVYGINHLYPNYVIYFRITAAVLAAICFILFICTKRYSFGMLRWTKVLIAAMILDDFGGVVVLASDLDVSLVNAFDICSGTIISSLVSVCVWVVPTYFYLRRRWLPDELLRKHKKPAAAADCEASAANVPEPFTPPEPASADGDLPPADPIADVIATPLETIEDSSVAPETVSQTVDTLAAVVDHPAPPVDPQRPVIRFCRYCGTELRSVSKFCDNCGKKVRK